MCKDPMKCAVCGEQTKYVIDLFSRYHLNPLHNIGMKEYYDKYFKKDGEGVCVDCGKETKWITFNKGYPKRCSVCGKKSDEIRKNISESFKRRDTKKEAEKRKITCKEKYGVDYISQLDSSKEKSKQTNLALYGVEFTAHLSHVKDARVKSLSDNFDEINDKRKLWWDTQADIEDIGEKRRITCLEKYGVEYISQSDNAIKKIRETNEKLGRWIPNEKMNLFKRYWLDVRSYTLKNKDVLFGNWDGICHYTGLPIGSVKNKQQSGFYPTIDHKKSVFYGFVNNISASDIGDISNLCICCRSINSMKSKMVDDDFLVVVDEAKKKVCEKWKIFQSLETQDMK